MLDNTYPIYLAGRAVEPNHDLAVTDKHSGEVVAHVPLARPEHVEEAIAAADAARTELASMPAHARAAALRHCIAQFERDRDVLAHVLCVEAGKPAQHAAGEVQRLIETFEVAAGEATRIGGEVIPLDIGPRTERYRGMTRRVPIGPCGFITPFNFPLNLVAHKVAPAVAAGCPFVLKPTKMTPLGALLIGKALASAGLPEGSFSILPTSSDAARPIVADPRLRALSFTGSDAVGKQLAGQAGMKHVVLELGGNAACIVDESAELDDAIPRLIFGAYYQSGQSCISVQRIIAHDSVYDTLKTRLAEAVADLKSGDPKDPDTFIGPMITESAAEELEARIAAAIDAGATRIIGGERRGPLHPAALLEGVSRDQDLYKEEAFAPVALLSRFSDFEDAIDEVNDSRFGLQAGLFTADIRRAMHAWDRLDVGGIIINDVPSFRVDNMPYGGVKDSGLGREGVRNAIEHLTEPRLLVIRDQR